MNLHNVISWSDEFYLQELPMIRQGAEQGLNWRCKIYQENNGVMYIRWWFRWPELAEHGIVGLEGTVVATITQNGSGMFETYDITTMNYANDLTCYFAKIKNNIRNAKITLNFQTKLLVRNGSEQDENQLDVEDYAWINQLFENDEDDDTEGENSSDEENEEKEDSDWINALFSDDEEEN